MLGAVLVSRDEGERDVRLAEAVQLALGLLRALSQPLHCEHVLR